MSAPRYVPPGGRSIAGFFIPERTIVSCQSWSVHRLNPAVFGADSEVFRPERWLLSEGGENAEELLEMERVFFAFGAGGTLPLFM